MKAGRTVWRGAALTTGELVDIAIEAGRIVELTPNGQAAAGECERDCTGLYVSSGWIDLHVHAFPEFDPYGDEIDEIGVKQGVTTIVDAGSCGADRMAELAASRAGAATNMLALMNISQIGLQRIDELSEMAWLNHEKAIRTMQQLPDFIVGWKARMSGSVVKENGIAPLQFARFLSEETGLPLMVHIGSAPPRIEEIVSLLAPHDVITHYLNGKRNNLFDAEGQPLKVLTEAIQRGVQLDVGHGTASFSFRIAEAARASGIVFNTISSDIYRGNRLQGPVYSLAHVLSKFLYLGYTLTDIIDAVTKRPAAWLRKPELGRIQVGDAANLTLFEVRDEEIVLVDSEGDTRIGHHTIIPKGVFVHGRFIECEVRAEACH